MRVTATAFSIAHRSAFAILLSQAPCQTAARAGRALSAAASMRRASNGLRGGKQIEGGGSGRVRRAQELGFPYFRPKRCSRNGLHPEIGGGVGICRLIWPRKRRGVGFSQLLVLTIEAAVGYETALRLPKIAPLSRPELSSAPRPASASAWKPVGRHRAPSGTPLAPGSTRKALIVPRTYAPMCP